MGEGERFVGEAGGGMTRVNGSRARQGVPGGVPLVCTIHQKIISQKFGVSKKKYPPGYLIQVHSAGTLSLLLRRYLYLLCIYTPGGLTMKLYHTFLTCQ